MKLLSENRPVLDLIANALVEKEKLTGTEMLAMIRAIRPDLVTDEAIARV
jgi:ATP-dependent Zn protease